MTVVSEVLGTESGNILGTQSGAEIGLEANTYSTPVGPTDVRITVMAPDASSVLQLDASADLQSTWQVKYEKTPGGCGAATISLGLRYEEAYARGYWTAMNLVEISTGDDVLQASISSGATKLYVQSITPYNTATGEPTPQIYLWDGVNLTMRIPVTGVGQDSGGDYITVGSPLSGGGNPTTIPAYTAGATIIGRRRYAGQIIRRERPSQRIPLTTISLVGLAQIFNSSIGSYSIDQTFNVDVGNAVYSTLAQFSAAGRWPHLTISAGNFPTVGSTFAGTRSQATVTSMLTDFIGAISTGDIWSVIVDHDRTVRLVRLYTQATNTYTWNTTLTQGQRDFEPMNVTVTDQDASNLFNAIMVTGATNPATQQPYSAIVTDPSSITLYKLQLDGTPVSVTSLTSVAACAAYGQALLNAQGLAQLQAQIRVYTRNDYVPTYQPQGLPGGDALRGTDAVTVAGFDAVGVSANNCPDSEFITTLWSITNLSSVVGAGPNGSNALELTASGSANAASPPLYVAPGRPFTPTAYVNATHVTGGTITVQLVTNAGIVVASTTVTNGTSGTVSLGPVTLPAGSASAFMQFVAAGVTLSGGNLIFSQPMLAAGGFAKSYVPNYAAPIVYGLASSVATTIESHGDHYQDATFQPIEPDWNSAIGEALNSLAAQQKQNAATIGSTSSYCVSQTLCALSYSNSSLVVTVPTGLAIFAAGSNPVQVGGNTFTLPASVVSWVWLNSNNTYTIQQNATPVSGAILLGFMQTTATGVQGFTLKASIGIIQFSTFNGTTVNPANGYITVSDQLVHLTPQSYALPAAGIGSTVDIGWAALLGSTSVNPTVWLFSDAASQNGYYAQWNGSGNIVLVKVVAGTPTTLATSTLAYTKTTTGFYNLQIIATEPTSGTVNLSAMFNGQVVAQYADSSSPITSGQAGAQFANATATNQIDPNSIVLQIGGAGSSGTLKSQGSIAPNFTPGLTVSFGVGGTFPNADINLSINPTTIYFADGSSIAWNGVGGPVTSYTIDTGIASAAGTWYVVLWLVIAKINTGTYNGLAWYISQTAPTAQQTMVPYSDGNIPILFTTMTSTEPPTKNSVTVNGGATGSSGRRPGS